jgi:hypothetical protein
VAAYTRTAWLKYATPVIVSLCTWAEDESNLPALLVLLVVIVALVVGGGAIGFLAKRQLQSALAQLADQEAVRTVAKDRNDEILWNQKTVLQDAEEGKQRCELYAGLIKQMVNAQPSEPNPVRIEGERLYRKAKKSSDTCLDYLIANWKRRFENLNKADLSQQMKEARAATLAFVQWADKAVGPKESRVVGPWNNHLDWVDKLQATTYSDALIQTIARCRTPFDPPLRSYDRSSCKRVCREPDIARRLYETIPNIQEFSWWNPLVPIGTSLDRNQDS